jgi:hypothetical protein
MQNNRNPNSWTEKERKKLEIIQSEGGTGYNGRGLGNYEGHGCEYDRHRWKKVCKRTSSFFNGERESSKK